MNIFDIVGPVMVGPLPSGHAAGNPSCFYILGRNKSALRQALCAPKSLNAAPAAALRA